MEFDVWMRHVKDTQVPPKSWDLLFFKCKKWMDESWLPTHIYEIAFIYVYGRS